MPAHQTGGDALRRRPFTTSLPPIATSCRFPQIAGRWHLFATAKPGSIAETLVVTALTTSAKSWLHELKNNAPIRQATAQYIKLERNLCASTQQGLATDAALSERSGAFLKSTSGNTFPTCAVALPVSIRSQNFPRSAALAVHCTRPTPIPYRCASSAGNATDVAKIPFFLQCLESARRACDGH